MVADVPYFRQSGARGLFGTQADRSVGHTSSSLAGAGQAVLGWGKPRSQPQTPRHALSPRAPNGVPLQQTLTPRGRLRKPQRVFLHAEQPVRGELMRQRIEAVFGQRKEVLAASTPRGVADRDFKCWLDRLLLRLETDLPRRLRGDLRDTEGTFVAALGAYLATLCSTRAIASLCQAGTEPPLFVTDHPGFLDLALDKEGGAVLERDALAVLAEEEPMELREPWSPAPRCVVVRWDDFGACAEKVQFVRASEEPLGCHWPLGKSDEVSEEAPKPRALRSQSTWGPRPSTAQRQTLAPSELTHLRLGQYASHRCASPHFAQRCFDLMHDGGYAYCAISNAGNMMVQARGAGPWTVQNGMLLFPKARLQARVLKFMPEPGSSWNFDDICGKAVALEPPEQTLYVAINDLRTNFNLRCLKVEPTPTDAVAKFVGQPLVLLANCPLSPGKYEYCSDAHHITVQLFPGKDFTYQESRRCPDGTMEEVASNHAFGFWEVVRDPEGSGVNILSLRGPSHATLRQHITGTSSRRLAGPVERPVERVAIPLGKLKGSGAKLRFDSSEAAPTEFPSVPRGSVDCKRAFMKRVNVGLSLDDFVRGLGEVGYPHMGDAEELFEFVARSGGGGAEIQRRDFVEALDTWGVALEPSDMMELHSWLLAESGGLEDFFAECQGDTNELDAAGLQAGLEARGYVKHHMAPQLFKSIDTNRRGQVDHDGFQVLHLFAATHMLQSLQSLLDSLRETYASPGDAMRALDKNESGSISEEEWQEAMLELDVDPVTSERIFAFIDTDHSNQLESEELEAFITTFDMHAFMHQIQLFRDSCTEKYGSLDKAFDAFVKKKGKEEEVNVEGEVEITIKEWSRSQKLRQKLGIATNFDDRFIFTFLDVTRNFGVKASEFRLLDAYKPCLIDGSPKRLREFLKKKFEDLDKAQMQLARFKKEKLYGEALLPVCVSRLCTPEEALLPSGDGP